MIFTAANIHIHGLGSQITSICVFLLWVLVSAKTVMGVISGKLLDGPEVKDLDREDGDRRQIV